MNDNSRFKARALCKAMLATAMASTYQTMPEPKKKVYPNGPCTGCGKPNVRRGRETGVYLCEPCYKES